MRFILCYIKINHLLSPGGFPFQCMVSNLLHWSSDSDVRWLVQFQGKTIIIGTASYINVLLQIIHTWF
jgi:hypothetical protein